MKFYHVSVEDYWCWFLVLIFAGGIFCGLIGLFIFRDNIVPMIKGKNVMILGVSIASGKTAQAAIEAVKYYGGKVAGVSAIFSTAKECSGFPVRSVFDPNDLDAYAIYPSHECPLCKAGVKIDALVNSHGFSKL